MEKPDKLLNRLRSEIESNYPAQSRRYLLNLLESPVMNCGRKEREYSLSVALSLAKQSLPYYLISSALIYRAGRQENWIDQEKRLSENEQAILKWIRAFEKNGLLRKGKHSEAQERSMYETLLYLFCDYYTQLRFRIYDKEREQEIFQRTEYLLRQARSLGAVFWTSCLESQLFMRKNPEEYSITNRFYHYILSLNKKTYQLLKELLVNAPFDHVDIKEQTVKNFYDEIKIYSRERKKCVFESLDPAMFKAPLYHIYLLDQKNTQHLMAEKFMKYYAEFFVGLGFRLINYSCPSDMVLPYFLLRDKNGCLYRFFLAEESAYRVFCFGSKVETLPIETEEMTQGYITVYGNDWKPYSFKEELTALDFAFHLSKNLGLSTISIEINGKKVPLETQLKRGDQIHVNSRFQMESGTPSVQMDWFKKVRLERSKDYLIEYWEQRKGD